MVFRIKKADSIILQKHITKTTKPTKDKNNLKKENKILLIQILSDIKQSKIQTLFFNCIVLFIAIFVSRLLFCVLF